MLECSFVPSLSEDVRRSSMTVHQKIVTAVIFFFFFNYHTIDLVIEWYVETLKMINPHLLVCI